MLDSLASEIMMNIDGVLHNFRSLSHVALYFLYPQQKKEKRKKKFLGKSFYVRIVILQLIGAL